MRWTGGNYVGGSDEGHAGYVMVELLDAASGQPLPGFTHDKCIIVNQDSLAIPLRWQGASPAVLEAHARSGQQVKARIYFRQATIYALQYQL